MEQIWDAAAYRRSAAFVSTLGAFLVDVLAPRAGERVLDLGCGTGELAREIARRGASVLGVDASAQMVAFARGSGVDALCLDCAQLSFYDAFDAVFSNAALHWMPDHDAVFRGVARALRPGGRFVAECGGHGNVAAIATAIRAVLGRRGLAPIEPWTFASVDETERRLVACGFEVASIALVPRPTPLEGEIRDWLRVFIAASLAQVDAADRPLVEDEIATLLAPALRDRSGRWIADYVRLRFVARSLGFAAP